MVGIIIAGGLGTRLRPLTHSRPKHLLPVANRPFLEYQVALLRRHGIRRIVFATGYMAEQIEAHLGDGSRYGVSMAFAIEDEPLGTAGAIRNAAERAHGETAVVLNGDILTDFDLGALLRFHADCRASATVAMRGVARPHAFGVLDVAPDGRLLAWHEPTEEQKRRALAGGSVEPGCDMINAGIYVLGPEVVERIPTGRPVSIERETYPDLLRSGVPVYGWAPDGYWLDVGSPSSYLAATAAVLSGAVATDVPYRQVGADAAIAEDAVVDAATSIGRGCVVGSTARLSGCIILDGATVGPGADLEGLIAAEGVEIRDEVTSRGGAVLAAGSVIARGSKL